MYGGFLSGLDGKESACNAGAMSFPLQQEEPLEKEMVTHSSSLAWEIHGQRRLAGYSPEQDIYK